MEAKKGVPIGIHEYSSSYANNNCSNNGINDNMFLNNNTLHAGAIRGMYT